MRIALIADTHLSSRSPECVANWYAASRAIARLDADLTVHLGDITLDGQTQGDELAFAGRLMQLRPTEMRCVPGNQNLGDGSGEQPLDSRLLGGYMEVFGPDHWVVAAGDWTLLGINAQLLGTETRQEHALWEWIAEQACAMGSNARTALFLHRPLLRLPSGTRPTGRHVGSVAAERLLDGPLKSTLRVVVSGHIHQHLDTTVEGVRHLWMPSTAFVLPDEVQQRIGEKLVGIGLLELAGGAARFDLWCPDGLTRHDVEQLRFFRSMSRAVDAQTIEQRPSGSGN